MNGPRKSWRVNGRLPKVIQTQCGAKTTMGLKSWAFWKRHLPLALESCNMQNQWPAATKRSLRIWKRYFQVSCLIVCLTTFVSIRIFWLCVCCLLVYFPFARICDLTLPIASQRCTQRQFLTHWDKDVRCLSSGPCASVGYLTLDTSGTSQNQWNIKYCFRWFGDRENSR